MHQEEKKIEDLVQYPLSAELKIWLPKVGALRAYKNQSVEDPSVEDLCIGKPGEELVRVLGR